METILIPQDIKVIYVAAKSFPEGIPDAHQKLRSLLDGRARQFYGLSWPDQKGLIQYKAAAEILPGDNFSDAPLETFTIPQGTYIFEKLVDWQKDPLEIGCTFKKLLSDPHIDPNGFCLEKYLDHQEMLCMVRLKPEIIRS
jgi:hypothetical protein